MPRSQCRSSHADGPQPGKVKDEDADELQKLRAMWQNMYPAEAGPEEEKRSKSPVQASNGAEAKEEKRSKSPVPCPKEEQRSKSPEAFESLQERFALLAAPCAPREVSPQKESLSPPAVRTEGARAKSRVRMRRARRRKDKEDSADEKEEEGSKKEEVDANQMPLALVVPSKEELAEEPRPLVDREVACRPGPAQMPKLCRALEKKVLVKKADATAYDEDSEDSYDEESCGDEEEPQVSAPARAPPQEEKQAVVAADVPTDLVVPPEPEPELGALPKPGVDFHCFPPPTEKAKMLESKNLPQTFWDSLTSRDLEGMGMTVSGGSSSSSAPVYRCQLCDMDVPQKELAFHLDNYYKAGQKHFNYHQATVEALEKMKINGWKLKYEQILIFKKEYHCKVCFDKHGKPRQGSWVEVHQHLGTQGHMKALRCAGHEVPAQPSSLERREWEELMRPYVCDPAEGQRRQRSRSHGEAMSAARVVLKTSREAADDVAHRSRRKRSGGRSCDRRSPRRPKGWPRRSRSRSRRSQSPAGGGGGSRRGEAAGQARHRSSRRTERRRRRSSSASRHARRRARRHDPSAGSATNHEPLEELVQAVAEDVRFTQDTIAPTFTDGKTFDRLIGELQSGKVHPSRDDFLKLEAFRCDIVEGNSPRRRCLFSLNNRRLHCLKEFQKQLGKPLKIHLKVQRTTPEQQAMVKAMVEDSKMQRIVRSLSTKDKGYSVQVRHAKKKR